MKLADAAATTAIDTFFTQLYNNATDVYVGSDVFCPGDSTGTAYSANAANYYNARRGTGTYSDNKMKAYCGALRTLA